MQNRIDKEKIFDLSFAATTKAAIRSEILTLSQLPQASSVAFANAHVVVESHWNGALKDLLKQTTLIVPDGVPIAWLLQSLGKKSAERYSGPDLMVDLFRETKDKKHFFIGSTPEVLEKIKTKFDGLAAGFYSPPFAKEFSEEEKLKHLKMINESGADFVWVGLGAPKQEKYVIEMAQKTGARGVWLAVGAAFDFYAGLKSRAPEGLQKVGLEWAYRLASEPKRLTSRYLKTNPIFITLALKELAHHKKATQKDRA